MPTLSNRQKRFVAIVALLASAVWALRPMGTQAAGPKRQSPITRLSFDPSAPQSQLFDAIDAEKVSAKMVAKGPHQGKVIIENLTDEAISIQVPKSIVGVHVLPQFGGGFGGGGGLGGGGLGGGGLGGQGGGGQAVGGGLGNQGGGAGGFGGGGLGGAGGGMGFFSIPPKKSVSVPFHSVCLEHGKPDPSSAMNYAVVRPETYTQDTQVLELIDMIGAGNVDTAVAQAAAWHLASKMDWSELARKSVSRIGQNPSPYFSDSQLFAAQQLTAQAKVQGADRDPVPPREVATPGRRQPVNIE